MANQIPPVELVIKARNEAVNVVDGFIADLKAAGVETSGFEKRANELNTQLRKLENQQQLIAQFRAQKDAVAYAADAYAKAQQQAQALARELAQAGEPTKRQQADFDKTRTAVNQAKEAYQAAQQKLQGLRAQLNETGISSTNLADASRKVKAEVDAANASVVKLSQQARDTAQAQQAMGTLGVRSAQSIEAEIAKVRAAMQALQNTSGVSANSLATAMRAGEQQVKALELELRRANGELTLTDKAAGFLKGTMGQMFGGNLLASGVTAIASAAMDLGKRFVQTAVEGERLQKSLEAIYKNADLTKQQMAFVRNLANEAGVEMGGLSRQFVSFSASTKQANIPLEVSNELFASVTKAAATLGLSSDQTGNALLALSQMASKGTVAMEELRGQLGEALPGALGLTAKGMGLTEQQLIKLVESGGLAARDLFPALTSALKTMHGDTNTLSGGWNRLQNTITAGLQAMAEGGGGVQVLNAALKVLGVTASILMFALQGVFEMVMLLGKGIAALAALITGHRGVIQEYAKEWQAASLRMEGTAKNILIASGAIDGNTKAAQQNKDAVAQMGEGWAALGVRLKQAQDDYTKAIENQKKYTEAVKLEGESLVQLAQLRGDQQGLVKAQLEASENMAEALAREAKKHTDLRDSLQQELDLKRAHLAAHPEESAARSEEIKKLEEKVEKQNAETKASQEAARAAAGEVLVKKQAVQAAEDQMRTLEKMRAAMEAAAKTYAEVSALEKRGLATKEDLAVAQGRAAQATQNYSQTLQQHLETQQRMLQVDSALLDTKMQAVQVELRVAQLENNAKAYKEALMRQKSIEIEQTRLSQKVKLAEADATLAQAKATMAELAASNKLTPEKRAELDATIKLAEAKRAQAQGLDKVIDALRREEEAIGRSTQAMGGAGNAAENLAGKYDKVADSANRAATAVDRYNTRSSADKYSAPDYHSVTGSTREERLSGQGAFDMRGIMKMQKLYTDGKFDTLGKDNLGDMERIADVIEANARMEYEARKMNPAAFTIEHNWETQGHVALAQELRKRIDAIKAQEAAAQRAESSPPAPVRQDNGFVVPGTAAAMPQPQQQQAQPQPQVTKVVRIDLPNGQSMQTDESGAAAMENFMRALASSKAATGRA